MTVRNTRGGVRDVDERLAYDLHHYLMASCEAKAMIAWHSDYKGLFNLES